MTTSPFKEEARALYEAGYSPVPLIARDKRAYLENWSKYCVDRMSVREVKKFMSKDDLNIGVALGPVSSVIALDFDDDVDDLHKKILSMVPESPVVKVGKRGFTAFYRYTRDQLSLIHI